jgi:hypothetical protein
MLLHESGAYTCLPGISPGDFIDLLDDIHIYNVILGDEGLRPWHNRPLAKVLTINNWCLARKSIDLLQALAVFTVVILGARAFFHL